MRTCACPALSQYLRAFTCRVGLPLRDSMWKKGCVEKSKQECAGGARWVRQAAVVGQALNVATKACYTAMKGECRSLVGSSDAKITSERRPPRPCHGSSGPSIRSTNHRAARALSTTPTSPPLSYPPPFLLDLSSFSHSHLTVLVFPFLIQLSIFSKKASGQLHTSSLTKTTAQQPNITPRRSAVN